MPNRTPAHYLPEIRYFSYALTGYGCFIWLYFIAVSICLLFYPVRAETSLS